MLIRSGALMALLLLAACATSPDQAPPGPLAWRQGYAEGCDSGNKAGGNIYSPFRKNQVRYQADAMYRQGWDDGFEQCK